MGGILDLLRNLLVSLTLQFRPVGRDHLDNQFVLGFEHVEHETFVAEGAVSEVELLLDGGVRVEHAADLERLFGLLLHDGLAGSRGCHSLVHFGAGAKLLLVVIVACCSRELLELGLVGCVDLRAHSADLGVVRTDSSGEASLRVEQVEDGAFVLLGVVLALGGRCALWRRSVGRLVTPIHLVVDPNKHLGLFSQDLLHLGVDWLFGNFLLALGNVRVVLIHRDAGLAQFGCVTLPHMLADFETEGCWTRLVRAEQRHAVDFVVDDDLVGASVLLILGGGGGDLDGDHVPEALDQFLVLGAVALVLLHDLAADEGQPVLAII